MESAIANTQQQSGHDLLENGIMWGCVGDVLGRRGKHTRVLGQLHTSIQYILGK